MQHVATNLGLHPANRLPLRWLAAWSGLAAVLMAAPAGNVTNLGCKLLLGSICGVSTYRNTELGDRWIGRVLLVAGISLLGWAIGAGRRSGHGSRVVRALFSLRWAPLPALTVAALLVAFAHNPGGPTEVVVTVLNRPAGRETRTHLRQRLTTTRASWYRQSWDHVLGLPAVVYDPPDLESTNPESRFRLAGALPSLEQWKGEPWQVTVSNWVHGSATGGHIQIVLLPRQGTTARTEHRIRVKDAEQCPFHDPKEGFCYSLDHLGFREGASTVHLTVDFAGLD